MNARQVSHDRIYRNTMEHYFINRLSADCMYYPISNDYTKYIIEDEADLNEFLYKTNREYISRKEFDELPFYPSDKKRRKWLDKYEKDTVKYLNECGLFPDGNIHVLDEHNSWDNYYVIIFCYSTDRPFFLELRTLYGSAQKQTWVHSCLYLNDMTAIVEYDGIFIYDRKKMEKHINASLLTDGIDSKLPDTEERPLASIKVKYAIQKR